MATKLELLQHIVDAGVKLKNGKVNSKDFNKILKKFKLEGNRADEFRRITETQKDSAELKWADKFRQKTKTQKDSANLENAPTTALNKGDVLRANHGVIDNQPVTYIYVKNMDIRSLLENHPQVIKVGEDKLGTDKPEYWLAIPRGLQVKKFVDEALKPSSPEQVA